MIFKLFIKKYVLSKDSLDPCLLFCRAPTLLRRLGKTQACCCQLSPAGGQKTNPGTKHLRFRMLSWLA